jgi:PadR family transcriptional regulator PadR
MRRPSAQTLQVLQVLLDAAENETYGFAIVKSTGLPSGTIYPILRRLEEEDLVTTNIEVIDPTARRPRHRVFYALNAEGERLAREAIHTNAARLRNLRPEWGT